MSATRQAITELQKLIEPEGQDDPKPAVSPQLSDVLYVAPAPGGEHRNCLNCVLWASKLEQCSIIDREEPIGAHHVCGYHLFGAPSKAKVNLPGLAPVDPRFSGLVLAQEGVACENCNHFSAEEDEEGVCAAVMKRKRQAHVHPKGCCTLWDPRSTPTDPKTKTP